MSGLNRFGQLLPTPSPRQAGELMRAETKRQRRRVAIGGDSLSQQNLGPGTSNVRQRTNYGYFTYLNAMHRGAMVMVQNYAVAGQTSTTFLQRLRDGEIDLSGIDTFFWLMSGNGINQAVEDTPAKVRAVTYEIVTRLQDKGAMLVVGNIPPRITTDTAGFDTAAERLLVSVANEYIWQLSTDDPNIIAVDVHSRLVDHGTGDPLAGVMHDAAPVHIGATGAYLTAQEFFMSTRGVLPIGGYPRSPNSYGGNIIATNLSTWSSSEIAGTWSTKTVSHGVAGSDGRSDWTQIVLATPSAAGAVLQLATATINVGASTFQVGDTVQSAVEIEVDECVDMRAINMQCNFVGGSASTDTMAEYALAAANSGLTIAAARPMVDMLFASPEFALPEGTTSIQPKLRFVANGATSAATIRVRNRPHLRNLTALRA